MSKIRRDIVIGFSLFEHLTTYNDPTITSALHSVFSNSSDLHHDYIHKTTQRNNALSTRAYLEYPEQWCETETLMWRDSTYPISRR